MPKNPKGEAQRENSTQISGNDAMLEIARLQEKIKLLTIENQVLRDHAGQRATSITRGTPRKTLNSSQFESKSAKASSKGCSCKGNCSTKICGCVKRDKKCDQLCKCNNASCQNQGDQKEDEDGDTDGDYEEYKPLRNKHLDTPDNVKGLFSPVTKEKSKDTSDDYAIPSITFDSSKNLNFSSSDEENTNPVVPVKAKKNTRAKSQEKEPAPRAGRLMKRLLLPTDTNTQTIQRSRSTSNEKRKAKQKNDNKMHNLRKAASYDKDHFTDDSDSPLVAVPQTGKYLKNIADGGMMPLRRKKMMEEEKNKENSGVIDNESLDLYENDPNFDPTKPKKQLARTPTRSSNESSGTSPVNRVSDIPLPSPPLPESDEDNCPTPPELKEVNVDWNQHLAQLVPCKKCGRKFHPVRVSKHIAVCKGL